MQARKILRIYPEQIAAKMKQWMFGNRTPTAYDVIYLSKDIKIEIFVL